MGVDQISHSSMIVLFTDFGADDLYVAQMKAVLQRHLSAPIPISDLLHSAPNFNVGASAHLLAALQDRFPTNAVFLTIIDPGVGSARPPVVLKADDRWFVGPDNGLLSVVAARAVETQSWHIAWRPQKLSVSFHGRDLFAPIAAEIASGNIPFEKFEPAALHIQSTADDLSEIIYIDHYGNALTGLRAGNIPPHAIIEIGDNAINHARVFSEVVGKQAFWYENSIGLIEIAINRGNAASRLGLEIGMPVRIKSETL